MREYGTFLKEQREKLGIAIEKASHDTRISTQMIEALEHMEKDKFPSQIYLVGMLKLYAGYLRLDVNSMVEMLQMNTVQEKPIDFGLINMEQQKKKKNQKIFLISAVVVLIVILVIMFIWYFPNMFTVSSKAKDSQDIDNLVEVTGLYEHTFSKKDQVVLSVNNIKKILSVDSIDPPRITIGDKSVTLVLYQQKMIDVDDDGESDYAVMVRSIDTARSQLLLRLDPHVKQTNEIVPNTGQDVNATQEITTADGPIIELARAPVAIPIDLQLLFSNDTYYQVGTNTRTYEGDAQKGIPINIKSSNKITVYLSIDSFVTITVNNKVIDLERTNLPAVFTIAWYKIDDGYVLRFFPLR